MAHVAPSFALVLLSLPKNRQVESKQRAAILPNRREEVGSVGWVCKGTGVCAAGHKRRWSCRRRSQRQCGDSLWGPDGNLPCVCGREMGCRQAWQSRCREPELHGTPEATHRKRSYWSGLARQWLHCVLARYCIPSGPSTLVSYLANLGL